jgi:hypothetical protein
MIEPNITRLLGIERAEEEGFSSQEIVNQLIKRGLVKPEISTIRNTSEEYSDNKIIERVKEKLAPQDDTIVGDGFRSVGNFFLNTPLELTSTVKALTDTASDYITDRSFNFQESYTKNIKNSSAFFSYDQYATGKVVSVVRVTSSAEDFRTSKGQINTFFDISNLIIFFLFVYLFIRRKIIFSYIKKFFVKLDFLSAKKNHNSSDLKPTDASEEEDASLGFRIVCAIVPLLVFVVTKSLGSYGVFFVLFFMAIYFIYWLANKFSAWYVKNKTSEKTLTSILVWSNVVTWLLPPLGLFTGISAIKISEAYPKNRDTYRAVAFVCLTLCIINSIIGGYIRVMNN